MVDSTASSELQDLLGPVRRRLVVDKVLRPKFLRHLQLLVRGRRDDDCRSRRNSKLEAEDGQPPGALNEDNVAALELRVPAQKSVVCGERRAREGRRFLVAQMFGNLYERLKPGSPLSRE